MLSFTSAGENGSNKPVFFACYSPKCKYLNKIIRYNATIENTQASESRIRDTDMAGEMVSLSLNNILQQTGMTMMAQANQSTEGILALLR